MNNIYVFLVSLISTFVLSWMFTKYLIPILKSKKMGQKILEIGPRWHKNKEGTPTMGGLAFIGAFVLIAVTVLVTGGIKLGFKGGFYLKAGLAIGFALLCGGIGVVDDLAKFSHGKNEGLKAYQKYLLQLAAAGLFLFAAVKLGYIDGSSIKIPFVNKWINLGFWYYPLMLVLITGIVNSVNLTDGIDGLASSMTAIVGLFLAFLAYVTRDQQMFVLSSCLSGACLGFLVYNFHPARVFMGDTGSLFLGGLFVAICILMGRPLMALVAGLVYVIETVSVMIQVSVFKITKGKRVFKMTPIHHHFEKCGWSEITIVSVFTGVTVLCCIASYFIFK